MSTARLHGADHTELGELAAVSEASAAIVLSRGGARKRYAYRDPNEDCVGFSLSDWGAVAVIADGHSGQEAARCAIDRLLETHAPRWLTASALALEDRFVSEAADVAFDANTAIVRATTGSGREDSRTTLSAVVLRPREHFMAAFSVGDSHVFRFGAGRAEAFTVPEAEHITYLGDPAHTLERLRAYVCAEVAPLEATRAVVLATDGLSERGIGVADPGAAVADALREAEHAKPELRPLRAAQGVAQRALEAQRKHDAGDNIAAAVLWIE